MPGPAPVKPTNYYVGGSRQQTRDERGEFVAEGMEDRGPKTEGGNSATDGDRFTQKLLTQGRKGAEGRGAKTQESGDRRQEFSSRGAEGRRGVQVGMESVALKSWRRRSKVDSGVERRRAGSPSAKQAGRLFNRERRKSLDNGMGVLVDVGQYQVVWTVFCE